MERSHWAVLAAARFFLALVVVMGHVPLFIGNENRGYLAIGIEFFGAREAVLCFFIISGYSIAHSIARKAQGFYGRRFLRIYPVFFASLLISMIPWLLTPTAFPVRYGGVIAPSPWWVWLGNFLMLQTLLVPTVSTNAAAWSLSIESFYYLLAPWLRRWSQVVMWTVMALSALAFVSLRAFNIDPFGSIYGWWQVFGLAWAWLWGWQFYHSQKGTWARWIFVLVPGLLVIAYNCYPSRNGWFCTVTAFLITAVMVGSMRVKLPEFWVRVFDYLGDISYPLYIVHLPVCAILWLEFRVIHIWLYVAVALMVSAVLFHVVDWPVRKMKFRLPERFRSQIPSV